MTRSTRTVLVASILSTVWSASAPALTITLTAGSGRSSAWDGTGLPAVQLQAFASPPFSSGPITAVDGSSSATTTYTFTSSALLIEFTHTRTGADSGGYASSDDPGAPFVFVVDVPVDATISGAYTVTDTGGGDRVLFEAVLHGPSQETLHRTTLESRVTPNESFVVGQGGGDLTSLVQGPTTHSLTPGLGYSLDWIALIQDFRSDSGDSGATASGYFKIEFVPEPSTALLVAIGLAALAASRTRRASVPPAGSSSRGR